MSSGRELGAAQKLCHSWEYKNFFGKSEVFRFSECIVYRVKNEIGHFRLGMTIKAKGSSVDRNSTKRQIREIFRNLSHELGSFDYNVVIPASKRIVKNFSRVLRKCLIEGLKKEILCKQS